MIVLRIKIWPNQNQFWKGYKIQVLNIKNYYFIITIVLYTQLYQKIITRCSLYKYLNGMIITLVPREKSKKVACVLNGTEMLSPKATTKEKHAFSHIIQKAVDNNLSQENTEHLICDRWNYSVKFSHPPHPCMTDPTPTWHTPPPLSPTLPLHDPPHLTPGTFLGTKEPFFMGCFTVSLLVDKNSLSNFICHLSWPKKLPPAHTHCPETICEFLIAYKLLFFELE